MIGLTVYWISVRDDGNAADSPRGKNPSARMRAKAMEGNYPVAAKMEN
jgi:hypothetical protein